MLDSDKVTQEVESEIDGVLTKIVVAEGDVEVGATVATIDAADGGGGAAGEPPAASEEASEPGPETSSAAPGEPPSASGNGDSADAAAPAPAASASAEAPERHGRVKASPLARRIARERGVDLASLHGTGPEGRILAEDVEKAAADVPAPSGEQAAPAEVEVLQLTSIRKTIARRLTEAWAAPVFQLAVSADMTEALALREQLVARLAEGDAKPTVNDVLVKLAGVALARHTPVNATVMSVIPRTASPGTSEAVWPSGPRPK